MSGPERVGPVLDVGEAADAVLAAIEALNADVEVQDRGAYRRVGVPGRCVVTRAAVEAAGGRPVDLPRDLERVMPAFRGRLTLDAEAAVWSWEGAP